MTEGHEDEDLRLVRLARTGDRDAFTRLVQRHHARVRLFLGGYLRRADAVDDVAQDVFLIAYRRLDSFAGESAVSTWLFGIARRRLLEHLRGEMRLSSRHRGAYEE